MYEMSYSFKFWCSLICNRYMGHLASENGHFNVLLLPCCPILDDFSEWKPKSYLKTAYPITFLCHWKSFTECPMISAKENQIFLIHRTVSGVSNCVTWTLRSGQLTLLHALIKYIFYHYTSYIYGFVCICEIMWSMVIPY